MSASLTFWIRHLALRHSSVPTSSPCCSTCKMTAPAPTLEEINKTFDGPLLAVMDSVNIDEKIRKYLHSIPVLNLEDCAMLADDEKKTSGRTSANLLVARNRSKQ